MFRNIQEINFPVCGLLTQTLNFEHLTCVQKRSNAGGEFASLVNLSLGRRSNHRCQVVGDSRRKRCKPMLASTAELSSSQASRSKQTRRRQISWTWPCISHMRRYQGRPPDSVVLINSNHSRKGKNPVHRWWGTIPCYC